ncbi:MAG: trypsin-like peptidase domain-containing protein [Candidatus Woesearchaeota archaeon]|nr:trypsin-like peptidase domain-containing protein [Candidatus Woesearchaeota archaeon]
MAKRMKPEKKLFIWSLVIMIVLFCGALGYTYYNTVQLHEKLNDVQAQLAATSRDLQQDIGVLEKTQSNLQERTGTLETGVTSLEEDVSDVKEDTSKKFQGLEGKINLVEKESEENLQNLQDDLKSISIQSKDFSVIVEELLESVVTIVTNRGGGSGVFVEGTYIVTNYHVIEGISSGGVETHDGKLHAMRIVAVDERADLALLQIEDSYPDLSFARSVKVGTRVVALGNPLGLDFSVTEGIVSSTGRKFDGTDFIQIDVAINPGNSGGPIVNINSEIVGIAQSKLQGSEGLGFAIDASEVDDFVDDAIAADT